MKCSSLLNTLHALRLKLSYSEPHHTTYNISNKHKILAHLATVNKKFFVFFDKGIFQVSQPFCFPQFTLKLFVSWEYFPNQIAHGRLKYFLGRPVKLKLSEKNAALVHNLAYTGRSSCRKEFALSSKAESVESIVSSLVTQDNYCNTFALFFPDVVYTF